MTDYKTVPVEPTEEMWLAFFSCNAKRGEEGMEEFHEWRGDYGNFLASYQAMIAAAPTNLTKISRKLVDPTAGEVERFASHVTQDKRHEAERAQAAESRLADLLEGLRKPFAVVFMDGRNEAGTHLLPMSPYCIDDEDFYAIFDPKDGTAERVFSEAERAGHSVGHCVVIPLLTSQGDGGTYFEAGSPCPKLTAVLVGSPAEQNALVTESRQTVNSVDGVNAGDNGGVEGG